MRKASGRSACHHDANVCSMRHVRVAFSESPGRYPHCPVDSIVLNRFLQIAAPAGVGAPMMRPIFEDIAASTERRTDPILADQFVTSIRALFKGRVVIVSNGPAGMPLQVPHGEA